MLSSPDGTPLESTTKWYDCEDEPPLPHQQLSFLKWINPFNSNPASKSNSCATSRCSSETSENDSYRGVQGLKQFWNNQITATKDNKVQKAATLAGAYAHRSSSQEQLDDDVRCSHTDLVCKQSITPKRSQSLHASTDSEEIPENHINDDNFYKYKTASSKKRTTLSSFSELRKPHSFGVNFPLVVGTAKGEKIHWATREDIVTKRKRRDSQNTDSDDKNSNTAPAMIIEAKTAKTTTGEGENAFVISGDSVEEIKSSSGIENKENRAIRTCDSMAIKSSPGDKRDSGGGGSNGDPSQSEDSTNSLSCESPVRKTNATSRKCSFKTHSKNYYTPRKMTSGSKVAALTFRFNQLIQQDAAILEEVKRNNGILMTTSGHIYKIRESGGESSKKKCSKGSGTDDEISSIKSGGRKKQSFKKRSGTPTKQHRTPRDSPSKTGKDATSNTGTMTVKEKIRKFEISSQNNEVIPSKEVEIKAKAIHQSRAFEKPKVPAKSEVVLQRTKEVAMRRSLRKNKTHISTAEIRVTATQNVIAEIEEEEKSPCAEFDVCKTDATSTVPLPEGSRVDSKAIKPAVSSEEPTCMPTEETSTDTDGAPNQINSEIMSQPTFSIYSGEPTSVSQEEAQSKKSKYARLYEKFRFRSPFASKKSSPVLSPAIQQQQTSSEHSPDQKIVDALETVNKKLEHLSKSTNDISHISEEERLYQQMTAKMKPNESFLFRNNFRTNNTFVEASKDADNDRLIEAVNIRLINKTQSMDESWFPSLRIRQIPFEERDITSIFQKTDQLLSTVKSEETITDELYEPIASPEERKLEEVTKPPTVNSDQDNDCNEEDNIYQTLTEVKNAINRRECESMNSYESYGNYESVEDIPKPVTSENSYEICDPPEPPPPRKAEPDIRINNEPTSPIPALPLPKRIIPAGNPAPPEVDYSKIPPRPPKSPRNDNLNPPAPATTDRYRSSDVPLCLQASFDSEDDVVNGDDDDDEDDAGENIYDIIKHSEITSHCYESITSSSPTSSSKAHGPKSLDTISMMSNCYESISSLRRIPAGLHHSDSISTLSSDQKTNSLYGMTLGQAITPPSEGASDNSDDWVTDLSEDDDQDTPIQNGLQCGKVKQQFIVVRERAKYHRSPDWSKKVRDQRTHCVSEEIDGKHFACSVIALLVVKITVSGKIK